MRFKAIGPLCAIPKVSSVGIEGRTSRKWRTLKSLEVAEFSLKLKALVGIVATGRAGLGYFPRTTIEKACGKEKHHLIQSEVRAGAMEARA